MPPVALVVVKCFSTKGRSAQSAQLEVCRRGGRWFEPCRRHFVASLSKTRYLPFSTSSTQETFKMF